MLPATIRPTIRQTSIGNTTPHGERPVVMVDRTYKILVTGANVTYRPYCVNIGSRHRCHFVCRRRRPGSMLTMVSDDVFDWAAALDAGHATHSQFDLDDLFAYDIVTADHSSATSLGSCSSPTCSSTGTATSTNDGPGASAPIKTTWTLEERLALYRAALRIGIGVTPVPDAYPGHRTTAEQNMVNRAPTHKRYATRVACTHCARSKLRCDMQRPCQRCIDCDTVIECIDRVGRRRGPKRRQRDPSTIVVCTKRQRTVSDMIPAF